MLIAQATIPSANILQWVVLFEPILVNGDIRLDGDKLDRPTRDGLYLAGEVDRLQALRFPVDQVLNVRMHDLEGRFCPAGHFDKGLPDLRGYENINGSRGRILSPDIHVERIQGGPHVILLEGGSIGNRQANQLMLIEAHGAIQHESGRVLRLEGSLLMGVNGERGSNHGECGQQRGNLEEFHWDDDELEGGKNRNVQSACG